MKLLKRIFMAILTACLLFILIIALMFGADTITLSGAIKMIIIFLIIGLLSLSCYMSADRLEKDREEWQRLLDIEKELRRKERRDGKV